MLRTKKSTDSLLNMSYLASKLVFGNDKDQEAEPKKNTKGTLHEYFYALTIYLIIIYLFRDHQLTLILIYSKI